MTLRRCTRCGFESDDLTLFKAHDRAKYGRQNLCLRCDRKAMVVRAGRRRVERRDYLNDLKAVPCVDCGGEFPPCVMDFHHVEFPKLFTVASYISNEGIKRAMVDAEIEKCVVICANCHRIRHHEERVNAAAAV